MKLLEILQAEKSSNIKGGIYHNTQIKLTYNTNRIERSELSEEQTRYIYETNTLFTKKGEDRVNVDDIIESVNHFQCFDYLLEIAKEPLSENHIKEFHRLLKSNTSDARQTWFKVGEYKLRPDIVGGVETSKPSAVKKDIANLLDNYKGKKTIELIDIVEFHYEFEKIHPFQAGNGRVGRLIMFKECLRNNIVPFIIEDKFFYYIGLSEYPNIEGSLIDTCLSAQDKYKKLLRYFEIEL